MFWVSLQVIRSYFKRADPFYDEQENHSLIGVANVFLESLFYDVKLQYAVPIVNQKGEVRHSLCGSPSVVQDQRCLGSSGMRAQSLAQHSGLRIQCCCSFGLGQDRSLDLIPGLGA